MSKEVCSFCGHVHGDECPEFKDWPGVEGEVEDLLDVPMIWRCSGGCKQIVMHRTASSLIDEGWIFTSKLGIIYPCCKVCGAKECARLQADVEKWQRRGEPRGNN